MKTIRNTKGFTLIELIIIIVILGILASVAVPKYVDMKTDARKATANGILGAIRSTETILFARYMLQGTSYGYSDVISGANIQGASASSTGITVDGTTFDLTYTSGSSTSPGSWATSGTNW